MHWKLFNLMECCSFHYFHCWGRLVFFHEGQQCAIPSRKPQIWSDVKLWHLQWSIWVQLSRVLHIFKNTRIAGNLSVSVLSGSEAAVLCNCDRIFIKLCIPFSVLSLEFNSFSLGTRNFSSNLMPKCINYYTKVFLSLK